MIFNHNKVEKMNKQDIFKIIALLLFLIAVVGFTIKNYIEKANTPKAIYTLKVKEQMSGRVLHLRHESIVGTEYYNSVTRGTNYINCRNCYDYTVSNGGLVFMEVVKEEPVK